MTPDPPLHLIGYVATRRSLASEGCRRMRELGLPLEDAGRVEVDVDDLLRRFEMVLATVVHPDLLGWFETASRSALSECRYLAKNVEGCERLHSIEPVLTRDINLQAGALRRFEQLDEADQAIIRRTASQDYQYVATLDPIRFMVAMPGTAILALEAEWVSAQDALAAVFPASVQPGGLSELEAYGDRLEAVESTVRTLARGFSVASAAFTLPEDATRAVRAPSASPEG